MESNCPFCDYKQFQERLIAESKNYYLIATLGQITDGGYVLIFPKEHISCFGNLLCVPDNDTEFIHKAVRAVWKEYQKDDSEPYPITTFEHGIVGQTIKHAHIHILPTVVDLTPKIRTDFPKCEFEEQTYPGQLQNHYLEKQEPYLNWTVGDRIAMLCWNPPAPSQYLRILTAELLGRPERANWRTMDPELDKKLWTETVQRLKPYFKRS